MNLRPKTGRSLLLLGMFYSEGKATFKVVVFNVPHNLFHLNWSKFAELQIYVKVHIIVDFQEYWNKDFCLALV